MPYLLKKISVKWAKIKSKYIGTTHSFTGAIPTTNLNRTVV